MNFCKTANRQQWLYIDRHAFNPLKCGPFLSFCIDKLFFYRETIFFYREKKAYLYLGLRCASSLISLGVLAFPRRSIASSIPTLYPRANTIVCSPLFTISSSVSSQLGTWYIFFLQCEMNDLSIQVVRHSIITVYIAVRGFLFSFPLTD